MLRPETEVLTCRGWVAVECLHQGDRVLQVHDTLSHGRCPTVSWTGDFSVHRGEVERLVWLSSTGISIMVDERSTLVGFSDDGSRLRRIRATTFHPRSFPGAGWNGDGWVVGAGTGEEVRLAVGIAAAGEPLPRGGVRFHVRGESRTEQAMDRLRKVGYSPLLRGRSIMVPAIEIAGGLALFDHEGLRWDVLGMSSTDRIAMLDEAVIWSVFPRKGTSTFWLTTRNRRDVDVVQAIAAITGSKSRLVCVPGGGWRLTVRRHAWSCCGSRFRRKVVRYDGIVFGVTVPSGMLLVRADGVPVVVGAP